MIIQNGIVRMSTKRNFVNVGQALFAIEKHNGKTVVYDCGGESRLIVNAVLPYVLKRDSVIEILFISHYDNDHINGVQYLLQHCNVRHIVLPMVDEPFKFLPLTNTPFMSFAYKFILNSQRAVLEFIQELRDLGNRNREIIPRIHYVEPVERSFGDANIAEPLSMDDMPDDGVIPCNNAIQIDGNDDWIYLPFNRKMMTLEAWKAFLDYLELPTYLTCDDLIGHWGRHWIDEKLYRIPSWLPYEKRHPLKEAWHEVTGISYREINDFSMTLYSGPAKRVMKYGCLYTGDYNAKKYFDELNHFYVNLWSNISILQVPHHGSDNNFDNRLIIPHATHVIPNKEVPFRQKDVRYQTVWEKIKKQNELVVGTWEPPYK